MKTIKRKTMLYQTGVEYGDYTMNHVQGCAHGCKYPCYAFLMKKRFGQIKDYESGACIKHARIAGQRDTEAQRQDSVCATLLYYRSVHGRISRGVPVEYCGYPKAERGRNQMYYADEGPDTY